MRRPRRQPRATTAAQTAALAKFAQIHGRCWKFALRLAWENGIFGCVDQADVAELQGLRNNRGPSWLAYYCLRSEEV